MRYPLIEVGLRELIEADKHRNVFLDLTKYIIKQVDSISDCNAFGLRIFLDGYASDEIMKKVAHFFDFFKLMHMKIVQYEFRVTYGKLEDYKTFTDEFTKTYIEHFGNIKA